MNTRAARERAEELAQEKYPTHDHMRVSYQTLQFRSREAFRHGYLARDAEPTTVTAEQIELAAKRLAYWDGASSWGTAAWTGEIPETAYLNGARLAFRAAGFRIEGSNE